MGGQGATKLIGESADGEDFADGDSMNPDDAGLRRIRETSGDLAEAFGESATILTVAQRLEEPIRRAQQHGKRQQQAVEEIDQTESF